MHVLRYKFGKRTAGKAPRRFRGGSTAGMLGISRVTRRYRIVRRDFTSLAIGAACVILVMQLFQEGQERRVIRLVDDQENIGRFRRCACACDKNISAYDEGSGSGDLDALEDETQSSQEPASLHVSEEENTHAHHVQDTELDQELPVEGDLHKDGVMDMKTAVNTSMNTLKLKNGTIIHVLNVNTTKATNNSSSVEDPEAPMMIKTSIKAGDLHPPTHPVGKRDGQSLVHIAIGMSITSKKLTDITQENIRDKFVFFKVLLPSFCETRSLDLYYVYKFYIAHDQHDSFFMREENRILFTYTFQTIINEKCKQISKQYVWLKLIRCNHDTKPAWAQNDAMMDAYLDNYDYYYRLNDDVIMTSANWTGKFISRLRHNAPPNIGMVSPTHTGGHPDHYEFDFVHRTHIDIFGYYYPRVFLDLYADEWIANVYLLFKKCMKLSDVSIVHTQAMGKRYNEKMDGGGADRGMFRRNELARGKFTMRKFLRAINKQGELSYKPQQTNKAIAMSLSGNHPDDLWGALRNVFLAKVYFPTYRVRFYICNPKLDRACAVDKRFLRQLKHAGAELKQIETRFAMKVPVPLWKYLALDDQKLATVVLRDPASRLSSMDLIVAIEFDGRLNSKLVVCIRDFMGAVTTGRPLEDNRLHFKSTLLRRKFRDSKKTRSMFDEISYFIDHHTKSSDYADQKVKAFLDYFLWPRVSAYSYTYDSNVVKGSKNALINPLPKRFRLKAKERQWFYIGRKYDAYDTLPIYLQHENELKQDESSDEGK